MVLERIITEHLRSDLESYKYILIMDVSKKYPKETQNGKGRTSAELEKKNG